MGLIEILTALAIGGGVFVVVLAAVAGSRRLLRFVPPPRRARATAIPATWEPIVRRLVPMASVLAPPDFERLLSLTEEFLATAPLEGCAGFVITDEVRVTVAATASLLLLKLRYPRFSVLERILIYPETFVPRRARGRNDDDPDAPERALSGEAWRDGMVVLAWSDVLANIANRRSGSVILHEFAHLLDAEDAVFNGVPLLEPPQSEKVFDEVSAREFERLRGALSRSEPTAIDPYGATNRGEFFAVVTEMFFTDAERLRQTSADLYDQLRLYYGQDPAAGIGTARISAPQ
jgi:MtfA peptidase